MSIEEIEEQPIQQEYLSRSTQEFLDIVQRYMEPGEIERVLRALQLIQAIRWGGTPSIDLSQRSINLATILAQMHVDSIGVVAGLVFEFVNADRLPLERVGSVMGSTVTHVIDSVREMNTLERRMRRVATQANDDTKSQADKNFEQKNQRIHEILRRQQAEKARKMLVAMAKDPRAVILKLAYQLHCMRMKHAASHNIDHEELLAMAQAAQDIYVPLSDRLGLWRIESELEDLAFEILEPKTQTWVRNHIEIESKQWRLYVDTVCTILREELAQIGLRAEISGRVKPLYSFYKKLQKLSGNLERLEDLQAAAHRIQIDDLLAFRILVDSTPDCYVALGQIHRLWKPKDGRIKDFIANPKPNGYQALHTTVLSLDDQFIEIQIRTFAMHEVAEYGLAMHWYYKEKGDRASTSAKELLSWIRQLANWQFELRNASTKDSEFIEAVRDEIFEEQIFVFTPKGEVKDLPIGSTPLDFAYRIHSKIGDRCAGARIISASGSGDSERLVTRLVPLDYNLKSGEIVDIVTNRSAHPTRDWLNFARTAAARSKIRRYLKIHERDINIQIGRERLDRELKARGLHGVEALAEDAQNWLLSEFRKESFEDLLAAIGGNDIRQHAVAVKLVDYFQWHEAFDGKKSKEEEGTLLPLISTKVAPPARLQVAGVSGLLTSLANCCNPLPGDEIVGFISRSKGAIIHRANCKNIERYRERERERLIDVSWTSMGYQRYLAPVLIRAYDRSGLIRDIATVVSEAGVDMTSVSSNVSAGKQEVVINATLEIDGLEQMQKVFTRLERVKGVIGIERDLGKVKKK